MAVTDRDNDGDGRFDGSSAFDIRTFFPRMDLDATLITPVVWKSKLIVLPYWRESVLVQECLLLKVGR